MFVVPALTAVTNPVDAFTVATAVFVLVQLPPDVPSLLYNAVVPIQSGEVPLTVPAVTGGLTVSTLFEDTGLAHPLLTVYVMPVVPALTGVTNPEAAFTVATEGFVLLQFPPDVPLLLYVAVAPIQSGEVPLTVPDVTFKLTVSDLVEDAGLPHPLFIVYVMLVLPALAAVTNPVTAFTVATNVLLLLQLPPDVPVLLYVAVAPMQSGEVPLTVPAVTFVLTVNVLSDDAGLPHPLLTV